LRSLIKRNILIAGVTVLIAMLGIAVFVARSGSKQVNAAMFGEAGSRRFVGSGGDTKDGH
jgi:hypothetical protein